MAVRYNNRTLRDDAIQSRCLDNGPTSVWCRCVVAGLDRYSCGYTIGNSYSVGNGGSIVVEVHADVNGEPGSAVLGRTQGVFIPQDNPFLDYPVLEFENPVNLVAGQVYHLVYTNSTPPTTCSLSNLTVEEARNCSTNEGAMGLNGQWFGYFGSDIVKLDPFRNRSSAVLVRHEQGGAWTVDADNVSWYEVRYDDGIWIGDSYSGFGSVAEGRHIIGGAKLARQIFTVQDADREVNGVWLNFGHDYDADPTGSPLTLVLKDQDDQVLSTGKIPASDVCIEKSRQGLLLGNIQDLHCRDWGYSPLSSTTLLSQDQTYSLEIVAELDAGFALSTYFPLSSGAYESTSRNHWNDSRAEISADGGLSWQEWTSTYVGRDLPLLFTIKGQPNLLP